MRAVISHSYAVVFTGKFRRGCLPMEENF